MASAKHQRPPDQLRSSFPLTLRGILPFLHAPCTQGFRSGAYMVLYTIMHHFCTAIQWWRFQDPMPSLKINFPKSNSHLEGGPLNSLVWQSMAAIRRPFKDPNHLALQELGWQFHSQLFQGVFSGLINSFNKLSRHQVFQYSLGNSIGPYRYQSINLYVLGPIGTIHIPLREFNHTAQISRWPDQY
ncbi:hypothetical protein O181_034699 [Austropuccinia psidii MF-1]|uniref:Uncharacterized protein n=1 Tax=Austropuccinia psidii MF-1 TaxID=1389203 RepID=A0A9Q3D199_9BASI|nr:hypothetical protein [Austropuccinia psidii MF-1]